MGTAGRYRRTSRQSPTTLVGRLRCSLFPDRDQGRNSTSFISVKSPFPSCSVTLNGSGTLGDRQFSIFTSWFSRITAFKPATPANWHLDSTFMDVLRPPFDELQPSPSV